MPEAQPGQEQRMERPEIIRAREIADERYWGDLRNDATAKRYYDTAVACIIEALQTARPTADLGELTPSFKAMPPLQKWETLVLSGLIGTDEPWIEDMRCALREQDDRLILYREALADLLRAAGTIALHHGIDMDAECAAHPNSPFAKARDVLSRSA